MSVVVDLLRDPGEIARRCHDDDGLGEIAVAALASIAIGAGVFGAVLGSFRGDAQILFSALKIPMALFATLALSVPAFHALSAAFGRPWPLRVVAGLTLAASARCALVLLALSPVLWLAMDWGLGYHASILAATLVYGLSGLAALGVLLRGLGDSPGRIALAGFFIVVFFAVGGQSAWILRPYLGRPSQDEIPFVRATEGSFADAVVLSSRSMLGIYDEPHDLDLRSEPYDERRPSWEPAAEPATYEAPMPEDVSYEPTESAPSYGRGAGVTWERRR